ncbi:MAG: exodeoxyribonuclease V subunit beta [Pseudomonadales bacterium]|nr:exodeoxyribonuclease V subunit beta [Pseudomonadales bacterium]
MSFDHTLLLREQHLIEASAGTGKTHLITTLYLRLILGRGTPDAIAHPVQNILVVTFTIAATQELKNRIRNRIKLAHDAFKQGASKDAEISDLIADSAHPEQDIGYLNLALLWFDEAKIFTIHGFCARVIQDTSFEAGLLFEQRLDAHPHDALTRAAQDVFRNLMSGLPPLEEALALNLWPTPDVLANSIAPLIRIPHPHFSPAPAATGFSSTLPAKMRAAKDAWIAEDITALLRRSEIRKNSKAWHRLEEMEKFCASDALGPDQVLWGLWTTSALKTQIKKGFEPPIHPLFDELEVIQTALTKQGQVISRLWQTTLDAVRAHLIAQQTQGALTLDDLLSIVKQSVTAQPLLAETLSRDYPAILVDEFQDTDQQQYAIFKRIHQAASPDHLLMLIGDPKQAIYSFRGADIHTYLKAKDDSEHQHSLQTNWRSSAELVTATNRLFDQRQLFSKENSIEFLPSLANAAPNPDALTLAGKPAPPIWFCIDDPEFALRTQPQDRARLAARCAGEIASWLKPDAPLRINRNQIRAEQIALLTRNRLEAELLKAALQQRGIDSVFLSQDKVLEQDLTIELAVVLTAVLTPMHRPAVLSALSTQLLQTPLQRLQALQQDLQALNRVFETFTAYQKIWRSRGIAALILHLIQDQNLAQRWLSQPNGPRVLTNLRHLAELLQQQSQITTSREQLITWLIQDHQRDTQSVEDIQQLRLETDADLVKIMTLHGAKGLEFDIVCLPFAHFGKPPANAANKPLLCYQANQDGTIEAWVNLDGRDDLKQAAVTAQQEEDMRLLYVAMTRARYLTLLGLGASKGFQASPAAQLLGYPSTDPLAALSKLPETQFRLCLGGALPDSSVRRNATTAENWLPALTKPVVHNAWQLHSYTRIVKTQLQPATPTPQLPITPTDYVRGFDDDEPEPVEQLTLSEQDTLEAYVTQGFPRGPHVGVLMHQLLENIDFSAPVASFDQAINSLRARLNLAADDTPLLRHWLQAILSQRLTPAGLTLQSLNFSDRSDELEFHFPVSGAPKLIEIAKQFGYLGDIASVPLQLEGMMTGSIDLLCRHQGRYYVIDYKTNYLGDATSDYEGDALTAAIYHHQYDLQYLLYCVAVKKILALRQPDAAFEDLFGGVVYLFLRGMTGGPDAGVYFDPVPIDLIQALDASLGP